MNTIILRQVVNYFFEFLYILIFVRVLLSWFPINRESSFMQLIYTLTEPILAPIRSLIQKSAIGGKGMMLDFSPIIAFIFIEIIKQVLLSIL